MLTRDEADSGKKFMILPAHSIFNDYLLMFGLKSNITFQATKPILNKNSDANASENLTRTMNLDCDTFQNLLELYPETAENLKLKSLEKRSIYMYYKSKAQRRLQQE